MKIDSRVRGRFVLILNLLVAASIALAVSCSSSKKPATVQCVYNSDCSGALKCSQGICENECNSSKDCGNGAERCISVPDPMTQAPQFVCQAPEKKTCVLNSDCSPLFCASDGQCRNQCATDVDCPYDVRGLINGTGTHMRCATDFSTGILVCVDPIADATTYDPTTNTVIPVVSAAGGRGGQGGASSGAGGKGGSGAGGQAPPPCTTPQTAFIMPVTGIMNANFTSGVAARVADRLLLFTAYSGPVVPVPGAAGASGTGDTGGAGGAAPTGNFIYAQPFDPTTGLPGGTAQPLFRVDDGTNFYLHNVAVSSSGEIALLHGTGPVNSNNTQLNVSFLTSAGGTLALEHTTTIESAQLADVNALWSESTSEFVFSWKNAANSWAIRTKKFRPGGSPAGGDTNSVTTATGVNDSGYSFGVGVSGQLFGVAYRDYSSGHPYLTLLDTTGNTVGSPIELGTTVIDRWITIGGTSMGFSFIYQLGAAAYETFIPKTADGLGIQLPSGAGGAGGASGAWTTFTVSSTDTTEGRAFTIGDELGAKGVGTVYLETNGASFLYVTADGTKHYSVGTVISSATGSQVAITNYHGSFSVSMFDASKHQVQATNSFCTN